MHRTGTGGAVAHHQRHGSKAPAPAARKYYNKLRSRYFDQWIDRATDYNETTQYGSTHGAFIE